MKAVLERIMEKVSPEPNSGCWLWMGFANEDGYGVIRIGGRVNFKFRGVHRVCYELLRGAIPEGLTLDHLCRVRCCVNPDHLEPVTIVENVRRGEVGITNRMKTHCPYGHPYDEENTYSIPGRVYRSCRACHRERELNRTRQRSLLSKKADHEQP